jgi:hypothetical protein
MLRRLLLTLTLALLFGLGQQGAATHAISHFAETQQDRQQDKSGHAPICDKCVVYAGLASAAASTVFALPPATHGHTRPVDLHSHASASRAFPYAARAPPVLS